MLILDRDTRKDLLWLILGLALAGALLLTACTLTERRMARSKAKLWADAFDPPSGAELLYEGTGVARPDRRGCWAAYLERVYGTDDPVLALLDYHDQILGDSQEWVKNSIIVSDHSAVYDHSDGSSVHVSSNIAYDFPDQFEKYRAHYGTLFYFIIISRPPNVRERCREY